MDNGLKELLEKSASQDVRYLLVAKEEAKRRMKEDPTPQNIEAVSKATKALEACMAKSAAPTEQDGVVSFKNARAVREYLAVEGWKVSNGKIYKDQSSGLLKTQPDGSILLDDVERYIVKGGLKPVLVEQKGKDKHAKLKITELEESIRERRAKASLVELSLAEKEGDLISREDADMQMAMGVTVLRSSMKDFFGTMLPEIVHIVDGEPKKQDALMDFFNSNMNQFFNGFSRKSEYMITKGNDDADSVA